MSFRWNPSADNGCWIKPEVYCSGGESSKEQQEMDRQGWIPGIARLADEHTVWMEDSCGVGGQTEHGDLTYKNTKGILLSKHSLVPRLVSTTVVETTIWRWVAEEPVFKKTRDDDWKWWGAGENEGTLCPRGGDRAEHLLGTTTAITGFSNACPRMQFGFHFSNVKRQSSIDILS